MIAVCASMEFPMIAVCASMEFPMIAVCASMEFPMIAVCASIEFPMIAVCASMEFPMIAVCASMDVSNTCCMLRAVLRAGARPRTSVISAVLKPAKAEAIAGWGVKASDTLECKVSAENCCSALGCTSTTALIGSAE
jgi:hypothetical protein